MWPSHIESKKGKGNELWRPGTKIIKPSDSLLMAPSVPSDPKSFIFDATLVHQHSKAFCVVVVVLCVNSQRRLWLNCIDYACLDMGTSSAVITTWYVSDFRNVLHQVLHICADKMTQRERCGQIPAHRKSAEGWTFRGCISVIPFMALRVRRALRW